MEDVILVKIANVLFPGGLTCMLSVGTMSFFHTARLTDPGSKTEYRTLTSLKICSDLLIHHAVSQHSDHNVKLI